MEKLIKYTYKQLYYNSDSISYKEQFLIVMLTLTTLTTTLVLLTIN